METLRTALFISLIILYVLHLSLGITLRGMHTGETTEKTGNKLVKFICIFGLCIYFFWFIIIQINNI